MVHNVNDDLNNKITFYLLVSNNNKIMRNKNKTTKHMKPDIMIYDTHIAKSTWSRIVNIDNIISHLDL